MKDVKREKGIKNVKNAKSIKSVKDIKGVKSAGSTKVVKGKKFPCKVNSCANRWHKTVSCPNKKRMKIPRTQNLTLNKNVIPIDEFRKRKTQKRNTFKGNLSPLTFSTLLSSPFRIVTKKHLKGNDRLVVEFRKDKHDKWAMSRKRTTVLTTAHGIKHEPKSVPHSTSDMWSSIDEAGVKTASMLNHPSTRVVIPRHAKGLTLRITKNTYMYNFS